MTAAVLLGPRVDHAVDHAVATILDRRRPDGSWVDHLPSSAVSTATCVVALQVADPTGFADAVRIGARWLVATQGDDGGWPDAVGHGSTLNATALAVGALRLVRASEPNTTDFDAAVGRGEHWIERSGGWPAVADRTRCTLGPVAVHQLALTGVFDADRLPRLPFELILLPRRLRQKLSFTVPGLMSFGVMQAHTRRSGAVRRVVDRLAEPAALRYLRGIQRLEGFVGGFQESPLMASVVAFGLARAGIGDDIVGRCTSYLTATQRPDGSWAINRDLEFSASMLLTIGLADCDRQDDPRSAATLSWIERCQRTGDFFPTGAPPGGWGWSLPSGWPNTDDTASALAALAGFGRRDDDERVRAGARWLLAMQNRDGSWSCFARNGHVSMDAPSCEMTANAVMALHAVGYGADHPAVATALRWFSRVQRSDGSFGSMWYREATAGTARVLDALGRLGSSRSTTARAARGWLLSRQNPDGGWGNGQGADSSVEETSWAIGALVSAGDRRHPATTRAVRRLVDLQRPDGLWEPTLLGVYFLGLHYHDDHIANGYALQALGRWRAGYPGEGS